MNELLQALELASVRAALDPSDYTRQQVTDAREAVVREHLNALRRTREQTLDRIQDGKLLFVRGTSLMEPMPDFAVQVGRLIALARAEAEAVNLCPMTFDGQGRALSGSPEAIAAVAALDHARRELIATLHALRELAGEGA
jgi:hypothetical protein